MKVGIVTAPLDFGPSGPGVYLQNLCLQLTELDGVDLHCIHYRESENPIYDRATEVRLSRTIGQFEWEISKLNLDVLHYNYVPWKRPLVFGLDVTHVITIHGDLPFVLPEFAPWHRRYIDVPIQKLYSKIGLLDQVDTFVAVSETVASNFASALDIPASKFRTVYSGVDKQFKPIDGAASTVASKFDICPPYLLNVNNYMEKKNRETLLRSFVEIREQWPDLNLVLAGGSWEESAIPSLINRLGLDDCVVDLGFVANEDLPLLYSGATAFINPTLHETFGFTNLEAMACGCPVVTSNRFAVPEIVGNGAKLVSDPLCPDAVATATNELLTDETARTALAERGRKQANKYSWERTAEEVLDVYRETLSQ
ncbi:glycosyltransferase family 1 protein [Haloarcula sp. CBA1122]|uniref:glycosyltransferase family 4 protein n=1 Tax=Haloarcula sp. CBA1122 TaxID=2668069 RepID=UPI0013079623|nr:glycosyltransferase family 1 protein [Haloarcula sp. CBA1122]MUV50091.1 glycosyltransferase [Haloarcula sp. CBA1122]